MLLKSFRIKNFRSILDSGECYVSPEITILAGKNESGKTNILTALKKFNNDEKFEEMDIPLYRENDVPTEISFTFEIYSSEIDNILKDLGVNIKFKKEKYLLNIKKSKKKHGYDVSGELLETIEEKLHDTSKKTIDKINEKIRKLHTLFSNYNVLFFKDINFTYSESYNEIDNKIDSIITAIIQNLNSINNEKDKDTINSLKNEIIDLKNKLDIRSTKDSVNRKLISIIPKVILFSSFEDILPYEIELNQSQKKKIITDFSRISGLDIEKLKKTSDPQERKNIVNKASAIIDGDFKSFWKQNKVRLRVDIDGSKLLFLIYDEGQYTPFKPEQRSKGLQWFLSFYITLNAESEKKGNIILIDEPGLYLHAKAQEDVLKVLEKLSKKNQIIFTTHMPYLIDPDRLDRVRLVLKDEEKNETKIENKIHKGADTEALTPIITAIGLDLSLGIGEPKENNVLLEGISDYYYIQAMLTYLSINEKYKLKNKIYFIPSFGADKFSLLIPLLRGWGLNYLALLDHDEKGKKVSTRLEKNGVPHDRILFISNREDCSMEDLFAAVALHTAATFSAGSG